jgi:hypothetical protein
MQVARIGDLDVDLLKTLALFPTAIHAAVADVAAKVRTIGAANMPH